MAIAWATVENALHTWVRLGTGYAGTQVIFATQPDAPRPARPFATITTGALRPLGLDDSQEIVRSGSPPAGQEIEIRAGGPREFEVTVSVFTSTTTGTGAARAVLSLVQAALALPSIIAAFGAAGVSCFDSGEVRDVTTVLDTAHEGRAILDCRFYANEFVSEYVGHIEEVELTIGDADPVVVP